MVELEADDAPACAARIAAADRRVRKVCIWTPDKDLAQCVRDDRVVQIDRRTNEIRDAAAVSRRRGRIMRAHNRRQAEKEHACSTGARPARRVLGRRRGARLGAARAPRSGAPGFHRRVEHDDDHAR
jgi:hypothetical protein